MSEVSKLVSESRVRSALPLGSSKNSWFKMRTQVGVGYLLGRCLGNTYLASNPLHIAVSGRYSTTYFQRGQ